MFTISIYTECALYSMNIKKSIVWIEKQNIIHVSPLGKKKNVFDNINPKKKHFHCKLVSDIN